MLMIAPSLPYNVLQHHRSEVFGRKIIYLIFYSLFTLMNIPLALSTSINMLLGMRFVSGLFASACIALGGGSIADLYDAVQRTRVVGW